jgi:hypothetical protein
MKRKGHDAGVSGGQVHGCEWWEGSGDVTGRRERQSGRQMAPGGESGKW